MKILGWVISPVWDIKRISSAGTSPITWGEWVVATNRRTAPHCSRQ